LTELAGFASLPPDPLETLKPLKSRRRGMNPCGLHASGIIERMSPHVSIDRDALSAFCRRHHIKRLALFGSVLREDFGADSDVDVLVEFQAGHVPGLNFVSIEREFSGLLHGRRVDMVTPKFLNPRIRDQVLSSAEPLYVAA
jgi:predicted nucleotidyltransferase